MFKKLQRNFLLVSLVIIASLLVGCFSVIYIMVRHEVQSSITSKLERELPEGSIEPSGTKYSLFSLDFFEGLGNQEPENAPADGTDAAPEISENDGNVPGNDGSTPPPMPDNQQAQQPPNENGNTPPDGNAPPDGNMPPAGGNAAANTDAGTPPDLSENQSGDAMREDKNQNRRQDRNPSFSPTFSIETDEDKNITKVNMRTDMTEDFYSERLSEIFSGKFEGIIRYTDSSGSTAIWQYMAVKTESGYAAAFTEVSFERAMLRTLILVLLVILLLALGLAVLISWFFARRAIKPIEISYNKQKQFVADASHELKTPLTTINTNIDVLLSHDDSTIHEEKKWLLYIKDEAKRMSKLTNDLLYLARSDYDKNRIVYNTVSWTDVTNNVLLVMEARVFESGLTLHSDIAPNINTSASSEQLKQVVMILLDNAVKYTPQNGKIYVKLAAGQRSDEACLSVKNTGIGISQEDKEHIFDRFYRSDKARTHTEKSGYGLGLAIAKAIVSDFNGTITVESDSSSYTEFKVKLPMIKQPKNNK